MLNDLAKAMKALDGKKKLGRRVCPSCILARVSPNGYIKLSLDVLRDSWRTPRFQQHHSFPFLRIRRCRHRQELWIRNQRKEKSRVSLILRKATNHRQTKRKEMMTGQGLPDQGSLNQTLMTQQASWLPPLLWPSGSRR